MSLLHHAVTSAVLPYRSKVMNTTLPHDSGKQGHTWTVHKSLSTHTDHVTLSSVEVLTMDITLYCQRASFKHEQNMSLHKVDQVSQR